MGIWRLAAVAAFVLWAAGAAAQVAGTYVGVDLAEGMRLTLTEKGGGVLLRADGQERRFAGQPASGGFEALLEGPEGRTVIRLFPEPIGVRVVLAPVDAAGVMDTLDLVTLAFLREGVDLPPKPDRFLPAPRGPVAAFDAVAFVASYPFWEPEGAALAYDAVAPRFRTVIRLYPLVQADLLWKLCAGATRGAGVAEALRGQGVTCEQVTAAVRKMQASEAFDRFKRDVNRERALLQTALGCADDLIRQRPECAKAGAETAKRAVSMETAATVLARYR